MGLAQLAWTRYRKRVIRLGALAVLCLATMAFSTAETMAAAEDAGSPWTWASLLTPANVMALLTMVFHFGFLVSELRGIQARLLDVDKRFLEFARKDVLDARLEAFERRVEHLER